MPPLDLGRERSARPQSLALATLIGASLVAGCRGERVLSLTSTPPGATVRLDDEIVGVTPLDVPIDHYGIRQLTLFHPDSRLYTEPLELKSPWWAYFPVDIFAELLNPFRLDDRQAVHVSLLPATGEQSDPITASFIEEAIRVRSEAKARALELEELRRKEEAERAAAGADPAAGAPPR